MRLKRKLLAAGRAGEGEVVGGGHGGDSFRSTHSKLWGTGCRNAQGTKCRTRGTGIRDIASSEPRVIVCEVVEIGLGF
jgi:hypothetical protein